MKQIRFLSATRIIKLSALPVAMLLSAGTASAQWSAQQPQQYPQQYPQQQSQHYPQQRNQRQQQRYASQQELFQWTGRVDDEIRVRMNTNRATVLRVGNNDRANGNVQSVNAMPTQNGIVTVQTLEGRGTVDVIQQPNARNGYTTVISVRDPEKGQGTYRVAAYWQPANGANRNSGVRNNGRYGNGRYSNDRDGNWNRDQDR